MQIQINFSYQDDGTNPCKLIGVASTDVTNVRNGLENDASRLLPLVTDFAKRAVRTANPDNGGDERTRGRSTALAKLGEMICWIENWNGADTIEWDSIQDAMIAAKNYIEKEG